jgi:hypothetical protein
MKACVHDDVCVSNNYTNRETHRERNGINCFELEPHTCICATFRVDVHAGASNRDVRILQPLAERK